MLVNFTTHHCQKFIPQHYYLSHPLPPLLKVSFPTTIHHCQNLHSPTLFKLHLPSKLHPPQKKELYHKTYCGFNNLLRSIANKHSLASNKKMTIRHFLALKIQVMYFMKVFSKTLKPKNT
jgi:hypothetical protein